MIKRVADRLLTVKESNGFGAVTEIRLHEYEDWLADFNARVDAADFSLLSMTVIDDLAVALEKHGLSLGEITGRSFMSRPAEDGADLSLAPGPSRLSTMLFRTSITVVWMF
ncbi:hypothetical protein G3A56_27680 (plasmid) [Rhizobium oryzihabitans]|uniref:Uncharacterized protein n=1 Tax=Rhizobium oryzihabitans TaxID=2267833 RepID=A0A7L5BRQ4_9HYPH|nr:hypothetical protein [Rhizobium oryzihabitans]QIB41578.1 hypothetical protein G3A56_27680 [Rhizobium oryzihabitans]